MTTQPVLAAGRRPANRLLPQRPKQAAVVILSLTALLYLVELVNTVGFDGRLVRFGIEPRDVSGLDGVVWAPLLHGSWQHLFANTVPILLFGFLVLAAGLGPWISTTVLIWVTSGLGVWLTGADGVTVGASGVAFGWLAFLLVRGIFNRSVGQIVLALVLLFYWGGALLGLLPGNPGISWQAHLFGALGGVFAAWLTAKANASRQPKTATPQLPGGLAA